MGQRCCMHLVTGRAKAGVHHVVNLFDVRGVFFSSFFVRCRRRRLEKAFCLPPPPPPAVCYFSKVRLCLVDRRKGRPKGVRLSMAVSAVAAAVTTMAVK